MIPLIDVVFLILVAFIYASMFMTQKTGLAIDLPAASEAETELSEVLTLSIKRDGTLFLNDSPILLEQLGDALSAARTYSGEGVALFVMADREAQLEPLVQVMNLARQAGIKGLTIATQRDFKKNTDP